jgi:hypothetical protein
MFFIYFCVEPLRREERKGVFYFCLFLIGKGFWQNPCLRKFCGGKFPPQIFCMKEKATGSGLHSWQIHLSNPSTIF